LLLYRLTDVRLHAVTVRGDLVAGDGDVDPHRRHAGAADGEAPAAPPDAPSEPVESPEREQPANARTAQQVTEMRVVRIRESTFGRGRRPTAAAAKRSPATIDTMD
jgi:hypothetical protein